MTTVTGYTAARMKQIEDFAVVGGIITGNDLILIRNNGDTFDAGNVRGPAGPTGPTGAVGESTADGQHYTRRNGVWVPLEGQVAADIVKPFFTKTQAVVTGGPITSTTPATIATVTVPAVAVASKLDVSAWWNAHNTDPTDIFEFFIVVDGVTKATQSVRFDDGPLVNKRMNFSIPSIPFVSLAATVGSTVLVKARLNAGGGTLVQDNPGICTVTTWPV